MTPKEAEKIYGKELVEEMWDYLNLESDKICMCPEGLDIPRYEWEQAKMKISLK